MCVGIPDLILELCIAYTICAFSHESYSSMFVEHKMCLECAPLSVRMLNIKRRGMSLIYRD